MGIFLLVLLCVIAVYIVQKKQYEKTEYYQQTQTPYRSVRLNLYIRKTTEKPQN